MLDPFRPERPEEVARLEALQRDIHDRFKAQVRERRGNRLKADDETLFSGEFWTGRRALELGLIDGIGDLRSVLRARFGDKVGLRTVGAPTGWLRRRLGLASPAELAQDLLAAAEERALWARFGL
jgi:ClpP class serine protease